MADPKFGAAELTKFLSGVSGQIESIVKTAFTDAYRLGYSHGDRDAIARVLQAARPSAAEQAAGKQPPSEGAGAETHKLIAIVMQASPTGKVMPSAIQRSPANKSGITLGAISKALRRGTKNGIYATSGGGLYWLAGGTK
jgi:hypothetical protein